MAASSGIAAPSLSTKTPLKTAIPAHLQRGHDLESPVLSTPGSAKTYGETSESISTDEEYHHEHDTSDESLGIRNRRERSDAGELAVGSPISSISQEKDNENSASNTSKSSGNDSHNTSIHSEISAVVAQAPPDASSAPESDNNTKQTSKTVQKAAGGTKEDEDGGDDDARMLPPPSPSIRSFMLEYKNEPHPRSPIITPTTYSKNGEHQGDTLASPKLEAIDEVTEEMTTFNVNLTPALEKVPKFDIQGSKLRHVQEDSDEEEEDRDVSELSRQSSLLEILSPLARKASTSSSGPAISSTPSFISAKDGKKADLHLLTDSAFSSPIPVLPQSSHRELPPLPSPVGITPYEYDDESVEITLGSEGIKDILWNVPNLEKDEYEIKTPEMEIRTSFPFPLARSREQSAGLFAHSKPALNFGGSSNELRSSEYGPIPAKKNPSRTVTHTAENLPPKERSIPVLLGPNALPYARCPSGIDAYAFNLDDTDPYEAAYPLPGPVHVRHQSQEPEYHREVPIMTATAPTPIRGGRDAGEAFGDGRSRTISSNSSVSSAGTATTANIRARQRSEQLHNLTLKRDQARMEQEGRREAARVLRDIQDEHRFRPKESKKVPSAQYMNDIFDTNNEHAGWYYDSMAGGWKRRDSPNANLQPQSYHDDRRSSDGERTPRLANRGETQPGKIHISNAYSQPAGVRTSTAYARERARASHPIQTLLAANQARSRQYSTASSDAGHVKSRLSSRAPAFQYPGYLPNDPRLAQMPKHRHQGMQQYPPGSYASQYGHSGMPPTGVTNMGAAGFPNLSYVESKMDPRLVEMLHAQRLNAQMMQMNAQTSAQIAHNNQYLPSAPPREAFTQSYPDAKVIAAIQQSNARLAQMIAQTQQQMEQLQLFQVYQKANQQVPAPVSQRSDQTEASAPVGGLPVSNAFENNAETFTSAQQSRTPKVNHVQASSQGPASELRQVEASHKLSFPPGLPFPIYTKAPELRQAQGPESDPAVIASFRRAPAAVLPPLVHQETKKPVSTKPVHDRLDSINAARRRVEEAIEEAKQQSMKANTSLPAMPDQHPLSNRLLGIIPSGSSDNKTPESVNVGTPVPLSSSIGDSDCTDTSHIAAARRRVRSNAPSPEEMHTPARRSGTVSPANKNLATRSAPLRAPPPRTQAPKAAPMSDPKPRRYAASMKRSDTSHSPNEGQGRKSIGTTASTESRQTGAHAPSSRAQDKTSGHSTASSRRALKGGWTDFVQKMGGVPSTTS